jgi:NAD(P)-dependent dehydrogenase (short-subunit alcohol dehydrogenase family)
MHALTGSLVSHGVRVNTIDPALTKGGAAAMNDEDSQWQFAKRSRRVAL